MLFQFPLDLSDLLMALDKLLCPVQRSDVINYSDKDVQAAKEHNKSAGLMEEIKIHIWITHLLKKKKKRLSMQDLYSKSS